MVACTFNASAPEAEVDGCLSLGTALRAQPQLTRTIEKDCVSKPTEGWVFRVTVGDMAIALITREEDTNPHTKGHPGTRHYLQGKR